MKPIRYMTDADRKKNDMSALWKDIFHDADDYTGIVFDDTLDTALSATAYDDELLTSMIVGIPYEFKGGGRVFRALYACGVCTRPEYRRKGEIQSLMAQFERLAASRGFDFVFLIPANERLRKFYSHYGYVDMSGNLYAVYDSEVRNAREAHCPKIELSADDNICILINGDIEESHMHFDKNMCIIGRDILNKIYEFEEIYSTLNLKKDSVYISHTISQWRQIIDEFILSGGIIKLCIENIENLDRKNMNWERVRNDDSGESAMSIPDSDKKAPVRIMDIEMIQSDGKIRMSTAANPILKKKFETTGVFEKKSCEPEPTSDCTAYGMMKFLRPTEMSPMAFVINFMLD